MILNQFLALQNEISLKNKSHITVANYFDMAFFEIALHDLFNIAAKIKTT